MRWSTCIFLELAFVLVTVNLVLIGGMFLLIAGRCPDTFPVNRDTLLCKTSPTPVADPGGSAQGHVPLSPISFIFMYFFLEKMAK